MFSGLLFLYLNSYSLFQIIVLLFQFLGAQIALSVVSPHSLTPCVCCIFLLWTRFGVFFFFFLCGWPGSIYLSWFHSFRNPIPHRILNPGTVRTWCFDFSCKDFFSPLIEPQAGLSFLADQWVELFSPSFHKDCSSRVLTLFTVTTLPHMGLKTHDPRH